MWYDVLRHLHGIHPARFSVSDVANTYATTHKRMSRHAVGRMLKTLVEMRVIVKMPSAYKHRHYAFAKSWPKDFLILVDLYEAHKMIEAQFKRPVKERIEKHASQR